ncbi:MAG TPA: sulfatase [Bryobacteraceae bacterium]|nr:sulfatase [Bryobacteraceae bacterium]
MSMRFTRREILGQAALLASGPFLHTSRAAYARRPNFIFLLTDDQSYRTLSLTGNSFMKTPNIDRIGREGVLFTNAFVAMSLCAPSRACNLTGLYNHSNGIIHNQIRWNQELPTLPRLLHEAGYRTAHIGKFHMDNDDRVQPGYDYWAAQINQGSYVNPRKNINGVWKDLSGYDTNIITEQALEFMRGTKRDQPFCVWMGYKACHAPFTPAPGHENDFADVKLEPPASFHIDDERKPQRVRRKRGIGPDPDGRPPRQNAGAMPLDRWAERERNQYRCLMGVEDSVKRLFDYLEESKLADDTIIVYMGDNGFFHGEHGLHGKLEAYEEAIRVPMMVRYPRMIKRGQKIDSFIVNVDLAPTILDFCDVKASVPMQGRSWRPLVAGKTRSTPWRKTFLYEQFANGTDASKPMVKALRTDRYKFILNLFPGDIEELYDLRTDPEELKNLALDRGNRDLVVSLKRQMIDAMRELQDPAIGAVEATLQT